MKICERGWDWVGLCFQFQLIWFPQTRADAWAVLQQVQSQLPLFLAATSTSFVLRWEPQRDALYHRESWSFELDAKCTKVYKSPISTRTPTLRLVVRILLVTVGQTVEILTRYPMMSNDIPGLSGCSLDFPIELYPTWRQKKTSDCNWRTMTSKATWMSAGLTGASRTWF